MGIGSRVQKKIDKHGEQFQVDGGASGKGFFQLLDMTRARTFLNDAEVATLIRPALMLVTSPDMEVAENDTIARDGRSYLVRKVAVLRFGGVAVAKVVIMD